MLTALKSRADSQNTQSALTWTALQNSGVHIDYDSFAARWDSQDPTDQILHKLVSKFDGHGLTLKTKAKEMPVKQAQGTDFVDQMAKSATNKAMKSS